MNTEALLDLVVFQITRDVADEDFTAIYELLKACPKESLEAYLPEAVLSNL